MITVEIDRIRIEGEGGEVIYLTSEGARDLQEQLDDILGPVESEPDDILGPIESLFANREQPKLEPFAVTADPLAVKWDNGTIITAPPWDFM